MSFAQKSLENEASPANEGFISPALNVSLWALDLPGLDETPPARR
jgi:hypothetical protein